MSEFGHDGEVAQGKERGPKSPIAIHSDAVEHQPQGQQRDVGLGYVDNNPGRQESCNDDEADRERKAPSQRQREREGQHRSDDGDREPVAVVGIIGRESAVGGVQ